MNDYNIRDNVGDLIREARQELKLSQRNIAGTEMSREFVSLVEAGKARPSLQTLRVLAMRLGKPVGYFLCGPADHAGTTENLAERVRQLSTQVDQAGLERDTRELLHYARVLLIEAVSRNLRDLELMIRLLVVRLLAKDGSLVEYAEECESALAVSIELKEYSHASRLYKEMGDNAFRSAEYLEALKHYEKAAMIIKDRKRHKDIYVEILTYMGSTQIRLGRLLDAVESYRSALASCPKSSPNHGWGQLAMGLGWAYHLAGRQDEAINITKQAIASLRGEEGLHFCMANHNLAIMELKRSNWERAYSILVDCLSRYRAFKRPDKEASVLEDIAQYWFTRQRLDRADETCWAALEVLDQYDNPVLRGRIYRLIGQIALKRESARLAQQFFRMSLDLLRRVKASAEVRETENLLRMLNG